VQQAQTASYKVIDSTTIEMTRQVQAGGVCYGKTAVFNIPSSIPPYYVFTGGWPGPNSCGMALSTNDDGSLKEVAGSWLYANQSGIHGQGLLYSGNSSVLYSADATGDALWVHRVPQSGIAEQVGKLQLPASGLRPRHLALHPNGEYAYVILEIQNELAVYKVQASGSTLQSIDGQSLIPEGENPTNNKNPQFNVACIIFFFFFLGGGLTFTSPADF
jgi:carboxy-cis,cis-muconate cyclase